MQQSLTANPHELAEAFRQIGNGFSRLARALDEREDAPPSNRELEYVPLEEVEQPQGKPKARTPRAALKAVPKAAPVIEVEPSPVIERPQAEDAPFTQAEADEESAMVQALQDDPLPEFAVRASDETPEQIEAERQSLIAELKSLAAEFCGLTEKNADIEWRAFVASKEPYDKPRPWLREGIERAKANVAKARANVSPVVLTEKQAKESPGQSPDGKRKQLRKDDDGNLVAVYEGSHMVGRQATHEETIQNLDYWIDYWRTHTTMGQDLATIRAKVARVVGEFHDWSDLKGLELSKAIRVLQEWRPDLDTQAAKKGAKK